MFRPRHALVRLMRSNQATNYTPEAAKPPPREPFPTPTSDMATRDAKHCPIRLGWL
jgi:hypothetical protein